MSTSKINPAESKSQGESKRIYFRHSLFARLSLGLFGILVVVTIFGSLAIDGYFKEAVARSKQIINKSLASQFAVQVEGVLLDENYSYRKLSQLFRQLIVSNPEVEIYLLDHRGRIIADAGGSTNLLTKEVDLAPIYTYLSNTVHLAAPIFGVNPRNPKQHTVFSAARFRAFGLPAYVYIVLQNDDYSRVFTVSQVGSLQVGLPRQFIAALVICTISGLLIFYVLTRRLRRVMEVLSDFRRGNLSTRLPLAKGRDEVNVLVETINSMADSIESNVSQLQRKDELRRELIANVSHDLRSPATLISGLSQAMLEEDNLPAAAREKCRLVVEHCGGLSRMLAELFELSKFETKEIVPDFRRFSIEELADELAAAYQISANRCGISMKSVWQAPVPEVWGDVTMIGRVLTNLIDNALRYTPQGGEVKIIVEAGEKVIVKVADTGSGIPAEQLPHVFDRFYQVKQVKGSQNGLSGLGLAIVKQIIRAHNSEITVHSSEGQGTVFQFGLGIAEYLTDSKSISLSGTT